MRRVCITGIAGFIGSNLANRCLAEGWTVDGVDDMSNGHRRFVPGGLVDFFKSDFTSGAFYRRVQAGVYDTVFHLAAVPRVSYSVEHPLETNNSNVTKTLKLIEACRGNKTRFVFASSSSVYGGADVLPTHESWSKCPKSPYALQKSIIEDYLTMYNDLYGLDSASMRFFNVFGRNALGSSPYATALSAWLTAIKQGRQLRSDGDGTQSRDLCHVDNVTDALVKAAEHPEPLRGRCYNVACGDRTTNNEILDYLLRRYPEASVVNAPPRAGDVMHTQADISRATEELGYEPTVKVWEGIEMTCDWYDANWESIKGLKQNV